MAYEYNPHGMSKGSDFLHSWQRLYRVPLGRVGGETLMRRCSSDSMDWDNSSERNSGKYCMSLFPSPSYHTVVLFSTSIQLFFTTSRSSWDHFFRVFHDKSRNIDWRDRFLQWKMVWCLVVCWTFQCLCCCLTVFHWWCGIFGTLMTLIMGIETFSILTWEYWILWRVSEWGSIAAGIYN